MAQKGRTTRRFAATAPRKKETRDPYLYLIGVQLTVCALLVVLAFAAADAKPPFFDALTQRYRQLIATNEPDFPGAAVTFSDEYTALRDLAADAVSNLITDLVRPLPPPEAKQTGAGGWMGVPDGDTRTIPASCDVSEISLSAQAQPPISGPVTSPFGYRKHPLTATDDFHRGMDIAAAAGTEIRAALPGVVIETDASAIYGNFVTLQHDGGIRTTYCHCETVIARVGERLRTGELIATVGSTGITTGPHCHFELQKNDTYYNPAWVLAGLNSHGI